MPDIIDHSWELFANNGIPGKVEPHDIAEQITSHKDGGVFVEGFPYAACQHGKVAQVDDRCFYLHGREGAPGFHHKYLLVGDGCWRGKKALFFLTFDNQIERMVAVGAVFLAGIAGGAFGEDPGVFPGVDAGLFFFGFRQVECHVLAPHEAVTGLAGRADGGIEVQ